MSSRQEQFKDWMDGMDVVLDEFMADLPDDVSDKLDYSLDSLDVLEAWFVDKYASTKELRADPEIRPWDGAARYYGQVLVKQLGGRWDDNPDGPPWIRDIGLGDEGPPIVPMQLVSSTLARRTGKQLRTVAENNLKAQQERG